VRLITLCKSPVSFSFQGFFAFGDFITISIKTAFLYSIFNASPRRILQLLRSIMLFLRHQRAIGSVKNAPSEDRA
jgi:hypothetical protein